MAPKLFPFRAATASVPWPDPTLEGGMLSIFFGVRGLFFHLPSRQSWTKSGCLYQPLIPVPRTLTPQLNPSFSWMPFLYTHSTLVCVHERRVFVGPPPPAGSGTTCYSYCVSGGNPRLAHLMPLLPHRDYGTHHLLMLFSGYDNPCIFTRQVCHHSKNW